MGSSFTIEDPLQREQYAGMNTRQKAKVIFGDMGKSMWRQGKGFGMVGALYAGTECIVEGVSPHHKLRTFVARVADILLVSRSSAPRTTFTTRSTPA